MQEAGCASAPDPSNTADEGRGGAGRAHEGPRQVPVERKTGRVLGRLRLDHRSRAVRSNIGGDPVKLELQIRDAKFRTPPKSPSLLTPVKFGGPKDHHQVR